MLVAVGAAADVAAIGFAVFVGYCVGWRRRGLHETRRRGGYVQ